MADPIPATAATSPPASAPESPEDFETKYRARLKEHFGHDDPAAVRQRLEEHRQLSELRPKYEQAIVGLLQQVQGRPTAPPADRPGPSPADEEAKWRELARVDPGQAILLREQRRRQEEDTRLQQMEQRMAQYVQSTRQAAHVETLTLEQTQREYPEAWQEGSELKTMGTAIYTQEMPWLQQMPNGVATAAQIAAGRLGLAPMSKRTGASGEDAREEAASQNLGRPARPRIPTEKIELSDREKRMLETAGLTKPEDVKRFKEMRALQRPSRRPATTRAGE